MTEEEIRKIANDIFNENIMNNLDSSIIFKYVQELEKRLKVGEDQYNDLVEEKEELQALYDDANLEIQKCKEVIDRAIVKLERYSDIISEASAYEICVDLLHLLKEVE